MYGNEDWGGIEHSLVSGTVQDKEAQRTYIDYDPVTGRAIRNAIRQQVGLAVCALMSECALHNRCSLLRVRYR
jgi:hypothetical protein